MYVCICISSVNKTEFQHVASIKIFTKVKLIISFFFFFSKDVGTITRKITEFFYALHTF